MNTEINKNILTAKIILSLEQKIIFSSFLLSIVIGFYIDFHKAALFAIIFTNILYFFNTTYRSILFFIGIKINKIDHDRFDALYDELSHPNKYSVIVPIFKEASVIPNLVKNLLSIDYPKNKLQILLVLEAEDLETISKVENQDLPPHFEVIVIEKSFPQTKAKACNEALKYVNGEIVCIYDADDNPDHLQLRKVVAAFSKADKTLACVQCRLGYYNYNENWLTNMFEIEYETLFNFILPAAVQLGFPIPLGGTSNHLKTKILREIGGWDQYNITEDADLGLKLSLNNYKTTVIDSVTYEESPITFRAWIYQRVRWLKGYFHTFFVYSRIPVILFKRFSVQELIFFFHIMFLGPYLLLITPGIFLLYFACSMNLPAYNTDVLLLINFIYSNISLILTSYYVKKSSLNRSIKFFLSYPLYMLLHIIASVIAFFKLFFSPHSWEKTQHGLSKKISL
jgi:glycosyltransferase XagB